MVWIHGGSFVSGSGSYDKASGVPLVATGDVIVVTINYRLGVFSQLTTSKHEDISYVVCLNRSKLQLLQNWQSHGPMDFVDSPIEFHNKFSGWDMIGTLIQCHLLFKEGFGFLAIIHVIRNLEDGKPLSLKVLTTG